MSFKHRLVALLCFVPFLLYAQWRDSLWVTVAVVLAFGFAVKVAERWVVRRRIDQGIRDLPDLAPPA